MKAISVLLVNEFCQERTVVRGDRCTNFAATCANLWLNLHISHGVLDGQVESYRRNYKMITKSVKKMAMMLLSLKNSQGASPAAADHPDVVDVIE